MSLSLSQIVANAVADAANVRPGTTNAVSGGCCGDAPRHLVIGVFFDGTGNNMEYDRGQTDADLRWEAWFKPIEESVVQARVEVARRAEQAAMEREAAARARAAQLEAEAVALRAQEAQARQEALVWQGYASKASRTVFSSSVSQAERDAAAAATNDYLKKADIARQRVRDLGREAEKKEQAAKAARREADQAGREQKEKTAERKRAEDACYPCGPGKTSITNVVKLHDLYPFDEQQYKYRVYISGVGTVDKAESKEDYTTLGQGFGMGGEGGKRRLEKARSDIKAILEQQENCPIDSVTFDIFGFSRGAALARHFVNVVLYGLPDYRQKAQPAKGEEKNAPFGALRLEATPGPSPRGNVPHKIYSLYPALANVSIRFVGLFDTVGSFYLPGNADEGVFDTYLPPGCAGQIFHIVAAHERRKNFRFTSIKPGDGDEIVLAGAHSDIGGGYELYEKRSLVMDSGLSPTGLGLRESLMQRAAGAGALTPAGELQPGWSLEADTFGGGQGEQVRMRLLRTKYTCNRYAHVALHIMHQKAAAAGVPLDPLGADNPLHQVPEDAQHLVRAPQPAVSVDFWEKYVHVSAVDDTPELPYAHMPRGRKYDQIGMGLDGRPIDPRQGFSNKKGGGEEILELRTVGVGYGRRLRG